MLIQTQEERAGCVVLPQYSSAHPLLSLMFTTGGHAEQTLTYSPDHSCSGTGNLHECSGMSWRWPDPHRAKVICIVQEISGAIRRQVLLLSCFHQPVHIPVQLGRIEVVHYLTLHSTPAGLRKLHDCCMQRNHSLILPGMEQQPRKHSGGNAAHCQLLLTISRGRKAVGAGRCSMA